jgi:hypothetical protein
MQDAALSSSHESAQTGRVESLREFWQRARFNPAEIRVSLPAEASETLRHIVSSGEAADTAALSAHIPAPLREAVVECGRWLEEGPGVLVLNAGEGLLPLERQAAIWIVANCLGEPLVQDSQGNRLIHVYDRNRTKRMTDGARYHQTREGGSLHTDNVNMPDAWEFLVFGCVEPALIGGETVLAHGELMHRLLEEVAPEALAILREPFCWEYRGIADALYQAPIITYDNDGRPNYRYLRPYLESAHHKAGTPLSERQAWALDVLDSAMELGANQLRLTLRAGDILITHDSRILHGRTSFADHFESTTIADCHLHPERHIRRSYERAWVKQPAAADQSPPAIPEWLVSAQDSARLLALPQLSG